LKYIYIGDIYIFLKSVQRDLILQSLSCHKKYDCLIVVPSPQTSF